MTLTVIRIFFLLLSGYIGFYIGGTINWPVQGFWLGCAGGIILIGLEYGLRRVSVRGLSSMVFGLLLGIIMAKLIADILSLLPLGDYAQSISRVILTLIFAYLGAVMALRGKDEFNVIIPYVRFKRQDVEENITILDTSTIIDGRIFDIYKTKFFNNRMVVPSFVLQELHQLADSADDLKRERGRRGLDLVHQMQEDSSVDLRIHEEDFAEKQDVDTKLIRLAKMIGSRICTMDFNLKSIAAIQGVEVLNVNELVSAVKSVLLPGEELQVHLVKEGREQNQAVSYMADGTMIVVKDAKHLIGQNVRVVIVSEIQTQAGKMVFAKLVS